MSVPHSMVTTNKQSISTESLPTPDELWFHILSLVQVASWYENIVKYGGDVSEIDPDVGAVVANISSEAVRLRRGLAMTRLQSLQARLVDEFAEAYKLISAATIRIKYKVVFTPKSGPNFLSHFLG